MKHYLPELVQGLDNGVLPAFFLYDDVGSELYRQRVAKPDYYLYRLEREAIANCAMCYGGERMLDIGSGVTDKMDPIKANYKEYWALDIDEDSARASSENYIAGDFLDFENTQDFDCFFMGSTVSNLKVNQIGKLIRNCKTVTIAADFAKADVDMMIRAYTDAEGVGEAMEKNGLVNVNRWFGTTFDVDAMTYECVWNPKTFIVETNLVFDNEQTIELDNKAYKYQAGDKIRIGQLRKLMKHQWKWIFNRYGTVTDIYTDDNNQYGIFRISSNQNN